jgi:multidrug efflux pump subunit AcrA (membrane-fusion protein)
MCVRLNRNPRLLLRLKHALAIPATILAVACSSDAPKETPNKPAVRAHTEIVGITTVTDSFQSPGTIKSKTRTVLSSKVVGQILDLPVREGDRVHQGQLLVEIEGRDASAQLRRAEAAEAEARRSLDELDSAIHAAEAAVHAAEANRDLALATRKRYEMLRDRHSVSPQEFDEVDTRYKAATADTERAQQTLAATQARRSQLLARIDQGAAEVDTARVGLGYLRITSPIDGVVTARKAEPGMLATPGSPLLEIDDDGTYHIEALVEESRATAITVGKRAKVEIDAVGTTIGAQVTEIVPGLDPTTRTYTVKLNLTLPPAVRRTLRPGFFGRVSFPADDRQVLLVPESAIVRRGQLTGVYTVVNDAAVLRLIKIGEHYANGIEVLSGLSPGVRIVTTPGAQITDGVEIVSDNADRVAP